MLGDKYDRLLKQLVKKMFLEDEIRRKEKVINILLKSFSNRVVEHSNYTTSKKTDVSTKTEQ